MKNESRKCASDQKHLGQWTNPTYSKLARFDLCTTRPSRKVQCHCFPRGHYSHNNIMTPGGT